MPVLFFISMGAACTINVPWDVMDDYDGVRVVMHVTPDDADVLLNGKFIGAAYEFAASGSALRLASRQNELVLQKKGFREEAVDLRSYSSRHITLKFDLEALAGKAAVAPAVKDLRRQEADEAYEAEANLRRPSRRKTGHGRRTLPDPGLLTVTPEETAVYIDGKFWGLAPAAGKSISCACRPGKYVFAAFKPGFNVFKKEDHRSQAGEIHPGHRPAEIGNPPSSLKKTGRGG